MTYTVSLIFLQVHNVRRGQNKNLYDIITAVFRRTGTSDKLQMYFLQLFLINFCLVFDRTIQIFSAFA